MREFMRRRSLFCAAICVLQISCGDAKFLGDEKDDQKPKTEVEAGTIASKDTLTEADTSQSSSDDSSPAESTPPSSPSTSDSLSSSESSPKPMTPPSPTLEAQVIPQEKAEDSVAPQASAPKNEAKPIATSPAKAEPAPKPEPAAKPVAQTLDAALANLNAARQAAPTFDSTKMGDAGKKFRLGDGFDVLNGLRTPSCLEPEGLETQTQPLYETMDSYEVLHSNLDFYKKMQSEFGTEIGISYNIFSASLSFKTKMLKETQIKSDDVAVMSGFSYLKEKVSLYNSWAEFAPYFKAAYKKSPLLFRRYCGDNYTQDVTMGAGLYLIVKAEKTDSNKYDRLDVEAAVKVGIGSIFNIGNTFANVTNEQRQILKSYRFTSKCYSTGSTVDVCAAYNLNTQFDPMTDVASIQKRVNEARARLVEDVNKGSHLVVMRETLRDYEVPFDSCNGSADQPCPDRWKSFFDYRPRSQKANALLERRLDAESVCATINYWPRRCSQVQKQLQTAITKCTNLSESCADPKMDDLNMIMNARNPGKVQFWQNADRKGRFFEIDFNTPSAKLDMPPNRFVSFKSMNWNWLNDKTTSMQALLAPGWKLRLYEHPDERNAGQYRDTDSNRYYPNLGFDMNGFNDKISAFRLMPPADLP